MAHETLVRKIKELMALRQVGRADDAHAGFQSLFASPDFRTYAPADQRKALGLLINARIPPNRPAEPIVEAHRAAIEPLTALLEADHEPGDYQMLGICYVFIGDEATAAACFREGLTIERARDPQSNLCGSLMKWVSAV